MNFFRLLKRIILRQSRLEVENDTETFTSLPDDASISFSINRANNSKLASVDAEEMDRFRANKGISDNVEFIHSYYHGKNYSIVENSLSYDLGEFYNQKQVFKDWMTDFQNGDLIKVKINSEDEKFGRFEFNLRYKDDNEAITAPFPIDLPHTMDTYTSFQIVMNETGKSYVRIDTEDWNNKRIVDAYKGSESYEIIHIDDFKTKNRVKDDKLPTGILEVESINSQSIADLNILTLNDYYTDDDKLVRMDWGKMVSLPNIGNFSIKEFKRSSKNKMTLFVGTKNIKMARFDLLIIPENGKIQRIRTDNVNTSGIRETLSNVESNTSIYVDNIIVDVAGELKYYPYNFVFTVE